MPERIYTSGEDGALEALEETPFSTEDELQALIAEHPELLDGEQTSPGDARRWILITREKGIAASSGAAARWAVDHLIIDQDAVPTLAELKRGSNPEIRRTIVGQLLEYAAHASETWTADELRDAFERQADAQGRDARDELSALLQTDGEPDVDGFWENVSTNLAAKRLRLLFVADDIPDPLARVNMAALIFRVEETKTSVPLELPVTRQLSSILKRRLAENDDLPANTGDWAFPSPTSASGHVEDPHHLYARISETGGAKFWFHGLRNCFITVAERELMLPSALTKRLVNHARPNDVTEGYAADWTIGQLREPAQRIADRIDGLMTGSVPSIRKQQSL